MTDAVVIGGEPAHPVGFPLRGEWVAVNTPAHRVPSHGTDSLAQRYALDFVMLDRDGSPFASGARLRHLFGVIPVRECYAWGQPVLAPEAATVVDAQDGWEDRQGLNFFRDYLASALYPPRPTDDDLRPLVGNYVILRGDAEFLLFAHLRCGSVKLRTGETVAAGAQVGEVGNSGNSTLPHLHFQAMDGRDPRAAKGIPCRFPNLEHFDGGEWKALVDGVPGRFQRVRAATDQP